ncbi:hypothetical protein P3W55_13860 [Pseudomonas citronellolis]|uniref:Uncharacterized protein n=1 Tax=Pseudomonas citronellolis TaxID=53408 RepID=A0AAW6P5P1_9PSED|nr:hypothetical protein [Pseudomonas citronellolis]MDF3842798.1 hypothetical protein [Pseudomonas citronellolis]
MSDRELLELAAKAAGYQFSTSMRSFSRPPVPVILAESGRWKQWDPLHDDGDALRLAVKLAIEISPCPEHDSVMCEPKGSPDSIITTEALDNYGTRRAVVRAAAEIGRQME